MYYYKRNGKIIAYGVLMDFSLAPEKDWQYTDENIIEPITGLFVLESELNTPQVQQLIAEHNSQKDKDTEIMSLKQFLLQSDYVVIKIAEGEATKEEYADILAQRKSARNRINELENN